MASASRPLFCGSFPEIQDKFLVEISAQRRLDPLAPLCVVVNGHLVGLSLQRELAWNGCSHANIRFATLTELAAERAAAVLRKRGQQPLNTVTQDALMERAIYECGSLQYFHRISAKSGFRRAVWRTLNDLRGAGITREMMQQCQRRLTNPLVQTLRVKLADLLSIWASLERSMDEHGYADSIKVLEFAAGAPDKLHSAQPIVFYGMMELSELEKRFVTSLLEVHPAAAYFSYRETGAYAWVRPLYDAFRAWGFVPHFLPVKAAESPLLARVQQNLFAKVSVPSDAATDDDSLAVISAPSREREVEEVVKSVLYSPLGRQFPGRKTGVLLGQGDSYTPRLRSGLAQAGVKGYFHECHTLGETVTGRAFLMLTALLDGKYRRAQVMELLLSSPVRWPSGLADPLPEIPAAQWNHFALLAGIVSGRDAWTTRLGKLRMQFAEARERQSDDEDSERAFHAEKLESLEGMIRFFEHLFASVDVISQADTWIGRTAALWSLFDDLVDSNENGAAIFETLQCLRDLDNLRVPLNAESFHQRVAGILSQSARRSDKFQVHEPTVAPMNRTLGVVFDEVIIPGLVEKEIPKPASTDPLLLDDERSLLQTLLDNKTVNIPTRAGERERELFVFYAAVNSARKRIVMLYPRRDDSSSRERLPSTYLLKIAEAASGTVTDYAGLERFINAPGRGKRVAISRLRSGETKRAASVFEYHEAALRTALEEKTCAPLLYLIEEHPFFARGVIADGKRHRDRNFGCYDGRIEGAALKERFNAWSAREWETFTSRQLEDFARCPFSFLITRALDVDEISEPPEVQRIDGYDRSLILRGILEQFYRKEQMAGNLPLNHGALERLKETAIAWFAGFEKTANPGVFLLWQIDRKRMLQTLTDFVAAEMEESSGYIPKHFGRGFSLRLDGDVPLAFSGRIDRIDVDADGHARVVLYKTGRPRGRAGEVYQAGKALHLPIYRLAAEISCGMRVDSASDYYVSSAPKLKKTGYTAERWEKRRGAFDDAVTMARRMIFDGVFPPRPEDERCRVCTARGACGTGRMTAKWKHEQPEMDGLKLLEESL